MNAPTPDQTPREPVRLSCPLNPAAVQSLRAGDRALLSGTAYAARDAAHRRMIEALDRGESLPFDPRGAVIYYVGPTPPPPGRAIGSAGPTTAARMDAFAPRLHALGVAATIGKGGRSPETLAALVAHGAVYFGATGGAAALLARHITGAETIAWPELGPEAVLRLTLENFPVIVLADAHGGVFPPLR